MIKYANAFCPNDIATLHKQTISEGFLSKLGLGFLKSLYKFLIKKEIVLVYQEEENVLGFVSCTLSSKNIMRRFLLYNPFIIIKIFLSIIMNPALIKPLFETYRAPSLSDSSKKNSIKLPDTELLSISVSPEAQKEGIGTKLLNALETELKNKGITQYKVIAGEKLMGANKFYRKNSFKLIKQVAIHGNDISNVYVNY